MALHKFICMVTLAGLNAVLGKYTGIGLDWCNVKACPGKENRHTFCIFPSLKERYHSFCHASKLFTDDNLALELADLYNDFRNKWAGLKWPGQKKLKYTMASNMRVLNYDYELDAIATRTSVNCLGRAVRGPISLCTKLDRFNHNLHLDMYETLSNQSIKEHLMKTSRTLRDFNLWTLGFKHASPEVMNNFKDSRDPNTYNYSSHVTQMLWANIRSFAFAEAHYEFRAKKFNFVTYNTEKEIIGTYLTAAFAPKSQIEGEPVYTKGFPGENCPIGTVIFYDPRYPYLCGGDLNITELGHYLPGGKIIENLPNQTYMKDILGTQPKLISNAWLIAAMFIVVHSKIFTGS